MNLAKIRVDLLSKGMGVPIGNEYYFNAKALEYRWVLDNNFQVLHKGLWKNAESIDWDFSDFCDQRSQTICLP